MISYRFLPCAEDEKIEAAEFYEARAEGLGAEFLDDVDRVIKIVREHPHAGFQLPGGLRRAILHRIPFSVIYAEGRSEIVIVAVAHQKRRPGYWMYPSKQFLAYKSPTPSKTSCNASVFSSSPALTFSGKLSMCHSWPPISSTVVMAGVSVS